MPVLLWEEKRERRRKKKREINKLYYRFCKQSRFGARDWLRGQRKGITECREHNKAISRVIKAWPPSRGQGTTGRNDSAKSQEWSSQTGPRRIPCSPEWGLRVGRNVLLAVPSLSTSSLCQFLSIVVMSWSQRARNPGKCVSVSYKISFRPRAKNASDWHYPEINNEGRSGLQIWWGGRMGKRTEYHEVNRSALPRGLCYRSNRVKQP